MALLGAQLVITLIVASFIQKVGPHFSFARWLLCSTGLVRYLYPTDDELKQVANIPSEKGKAKKRHKQPENGKPSDTFYVPRNIDIQLETAKVSALDVIHLRFYTEYQWLLDFALYSAIVYILTEMYQFWFPAKDEMNLSMMWCFLVVTFSFKLLISLTVQYFKGEESVGERSLCIVMGFAYLLVSMMILIVDENVLELNLENACKSFNESASAFLQNQGLQSSGPASKLILKLCIALWCGLMGAFFTFPGLRIAKMHWDLLKCSSENKILQVFLNLSFALPFITVLLWIKPISRDYLTVRIFSGMSEPLITAHGFESLRLAIVVFVVIIRLSMMPKYLQAYLNMAYDRMEEQKKEAGRITNKDLQKRVAAVFYYLCVVTLQYVVPLVVCLYFNLMYKTLGGFSWRGLFTEPVNLNQRPVGQSPGQGLDPAEEPTFAESTQQIHFAIESLKSVFTEEVFRGLFGFATWWSCFTLFASTSIGMIYQSYFANN